MMNVAYAAPTVAVNTGVMDSLSGASLIVQLVLLILVGLSVLCWAVAITKWKQLKSLEKHNALFLTRFWKASSLDQLYEEVDEFKKSNVAQSFKAGFVEMQKLASAHKAQGPVQLSGIDNLERSLRKSNDLEVSAMESRLTLLATTGSTGPFIGLFGTVWGIMGSFHKIGATGSASLAVVAPGISEALVATAIGLAAAIPAVVLYNHFISRIKKLEIELNNFSTDFLNIVKRNFFRDK